jgi:AbrB family looped-hinge helix DNA binding protein
MGIPFALFGDGPVERAGSLDSGNLPIHFDGMSLTISMDKAGRLVVPKPIREKIGAAGPSRFHIDVVLDRIELVPVAAKSGRSILKKKDGMWVVPATGKPFRSVGAVEADRQDRMRGLSEERRAQPTGR